MQLIEEIAFVQPPIRPDEIGWDAPVQGLVTLWLPKTCILRDLTVELVGKQEIDWPDHARSREVSVTLSKQINLIGPQNTQLGKGGHTFTFTISIPSTSAPYERCKWGKVQHAIVAKAKLAGGGQLSTEVVSQAQPCYVVVNVSWYPKMQSLALAG